MVADVEELEGDGRIRTPRHKAQCKGSVNAQKWRFFAFLIANEKVKLSGGE